MIKNVNIVFRFATCLSSTENGSFTGGSPCLRYHKGHIHPSSLSTIKGPHTFRLRANNFYVAAFSLLMHGRQGCIGASHLPTCSFDKSLMCQPPSPPHHPFLVCETTTQTFIPLTSLLRVNHQCCCCIFLLHLTMLHTHVLCCHQIVCPVVIPFLAEGWLQPATNCYQCCHHRCMTLK